MDMPSFIKSTPIDLGNTDLQLDLSGLKTLPFPSTTEVVFQNTWEQLKTLFQTQASFYFAPTQVSVSQIEACQVLSKKIKTSLNPQNILWIGIGGSALGPKALYQAWSPNTPKFYFLDHPGASAWEHIFKTLNPKSTLLCLVTKSGNTYETLALSLLALRWIGKENWTRQVVILTDPKKGFLKKLSEQEHIPSLSMDPKIGGRFSIFTPVGLFALELFSSMGASFLKGAKKAYEFFETTDPFKNPLFWLAFTFLKHQKTHPIHVMMPYESALHTWTHWWVQLWAESLGKNKKGFTPIAALGPTDQHSLLQLLLEGPCDKITSFLHVGQTKTDFFLPLLSSSATDNRLQALQQHSLEQLVSYELKATQKTLLRHKKPFWTLEISNLNAQTMGALCFIFSVLTAFTGVALEINPFDQPAVEEGKQKLLQMLNQKD